MRIDEVKMKVSNALLNMIDTCFGGNNINEKFINSTLKIIVKQNIYKIDSVLHMFADQNGEIDINEIINEYSNIIDEKGVTINLKEYVNNDMLKSFIPNKILIIKREDLFNLLS